MHNTAAGPAVRACAALALLCCMSAWPAGCDKPSPPQEGKTTLRMYCGAGLRKAVAEAVDAFHDQTGITIECDYAGSGMLLSRIKLDPDADLFMPGDVWYVDQVDKQGKIASKHMVTWFEPVILVAEGNPAGVTELRHFTKTGHSFALGAPEACQIGRLCVELFKKNNVDYAQVKENLKMSSVTVNELGLWVKTGRADATIVWDAIAANYKNGTEIIRIPLNQNIISKVAIGVLKGSPNPAVAKKFVDFLLSDRGRGVFRKHNYRTEAPK